MKLIFFSLTMVLTFAAQALEVRISGLNTEVSMERSFVLTTSLPQKVVLDCQSFIQGLTVGSGTEEFLFLLEPDECENLFFRIEDSLQDSKQHCLELSEGIAADYQCMGHS
ncbi:MAG TPA: hypothetical protein VNJ01_07995 [Bacteriovoracaceae bacterium]|nr:hypothetical protein [Bacteriovoracaceae bacterium]